MMPKPGKTPSSRPQPILGGKVRKNTAGPMAPDKPPMKKSGPLGSGKTAPLGRKNPYGNGAGPMKREPKALLTGKVRRSTAGPMAPNKPPMKKSGPLGGGYPSLGRPKFSGAGPMKREAPSMRNRKPMGKW